VWQLSDRKIDQLPHLFASGHVGLVREIARLIGEELREHRTEPDRLGLHAGLSAGR
jgi:hypothetical protein